MARLTITVDVEGEDPAATDPHDVAASILHDAQERGRLYTDEPAVEFVAAEWED